MLVRCPVCESATVTVILNSKSHASCACCGSTWIQEGSWQRQIRPSTAHLRTREPAIVELPDDVIRLPDPPGRPAPVLEDPPEEAVAT